LYPGNDAPTTSTPSSVKSQKTESTAVSPDSGESEILDDDERQRRAARKAMDIFGKYIAHLPKLALD
ncbi:hypothetical protein, partial [Mycobacteroides abscessus]|uniref:hypothetical protein n=1 Tax=Mycobacteroides abscessus TaxID=36809 RepID=UPI001C263171